MTKLWLVFALVGGLLILPIGTIPGGVVFFLGALFLGPAAAYLGRRAWQGTAGWVREAESYCRGALAIARFERRRFAFRLIRHG